jgi:hypothetical protein
VPAYRIRNWDDHFENAASRKLKRLDWVAIPNRMDGAGYTALVDHPNGAAHLGAWLAIVEVASKQPKEFRGNLPNGVGGICQCLGRISRLPSGIFQEVIPRLIEIGWLEEVQSNQRPATSSAESPTASAEFPTKVAAQGREGKGREVQDTEVAAAVQDAAERMYRLHPKKKDKPLVENALVDKAQKSTDPLATIREIETCHTAWCKTEDWQKSDGKYVPKLAEWICDDGYTKWPNGAKPRALNLYVPPPDDPYCIEELEAKH